MDEGSIERLQLRHGEKVTAAHVNQLDKAIARNTALYGAGVRRRVFPWGTSRRFYARSGIGSAPQFQPNVTFLDKGVAEVRWDGPESMIGGVVPTINGAKIFTPGQDGTLPALTVPRTSYSDQGECLIYFKLTVFQSSFEPSKVEPVALPAPPLLEPYTGYKLALFLRLRDGNPSYDEQADRSIFCGQGFMAVNIKPDGRFESLWWAKFG